VVRARFVGAAVLAVAVGLLGACTNAPPPVPTVSISPPATPGGRLGLVRTTVDALAAAVAAADRPAFSRLVSDRDPTFASRARLLYTNLSGLPLAELRFRPEPGDRPLSAARQQLLGADAWVQPVVVSWRLAGDADAAQHRVWLTFVADGGGARLAGTFDGPVPAIPEPQPSWWLGPITARQQGMVTVLAGSGQPMGGWIGLATDAAAEVRRRLPAGVADGWSGRVVVEAPATTRDFTAVLGQQAEAYAGIAAVAYQVGIGDRPPLRVVVNPQARSLVTRAQRAEILRHEIVHLATRSPESPAPLWAVEGLAEWVAVGVGRGRSSFGTADLLAAVRRDGPPRSLPSDADFAVGSAGLNRAYAEAWLTCTFIAEEYSPARLGRLYAELDRGRSADEASRAVLGLGAGELTAGWRRFLVKRTEGG
jgi:hypothetical protein